MDCLTLQSATDDDTDVEEDELIEPVKKRRIETPEEASVSSIVYPEGRYYKIIHIHLFCWTARPRT